MDNRPHIKLELSPVDKAIEFTGWLLLAGSWALVIFTYFSLPKDIPMHFDRAGHPDSYGNKISYLILPFVGTVIFLGMTILNRYPWIFNYINYKRENALEQYTYATKMIRFLKTAIVFIFLLISVFTWLTATGRSNGLGAWFLPLTLGLFLVPSLVYLVKAMGSSKGR